MQVQALVDTIAASTKNLNHLLELMELLQVRGAFNGLICFALLFVDLQFA